MKKILIFLFSLAISAALLFSLCACTPATPDTGDGSGEEGGSEERGDPILVIFQYGTAVKRNYYYPGTVPTPPELEDVSMGSYIIHFTGWDREIVPVTEETTYVATYELISQCAKATFVMGDQKVVVEHGYFEEPVPPSNIPSYNGMTFVSWDKNLQSTDQDVTYTALYVDETLMDTDAMSRAYKCALLKYSSKLTDNDNASSSMNRATTLFYMVWHENQNPQGGVLAARIVEHLTSVVTKDQSPKFDACCYWSYNPLTASISLARNTPSVWDKIPVDIQLRLETMMVAFACLESYATSDYNSFGTGPGLLGNYGKDWNPNYRLANVPIMVYACYFFGVGDMTLGADIVNGHITSFNESSYESLVNTFQKYGWRRAMLTWTADARTTTDGTNFTGGSAKQLLCYGGDAVGDDTSTASDLLVRLGSGSGVANLDANGKPRNYKYKTFTLYESDKIVRHLINYNYGALNMSSGSYEGLSYKTVVSDHWYNGKVVAWIIDDTSSPYEGMEGMMTEFASGNRSSTNYTNHDFQLCTILLCAVRAMKLYTTDINGERLPVLNEDGTQKVLLDYTDPAEADFWLRIQVGNEDFIYKYLHGYQCYATGSYGESTNKGYEKDNNSNDYRISKSVWRTYMMQWGSIPIAESFSTPQEN